MRSSSSQEDARIRGDSADGLDAVQDPTIRHIRKTRYRFSAVNALDFGDRDRGGLDRLDWVIMPLER